MHLVEDPARYHHQQQLLQQQEDDRKDHTDVDQKVATYQNPEEYEMKQPQRSHHHPPSQPHHQQHHLQSHPPHSSPPFPSPPPATIPPAHLQAIQFLQHIPMSIDPGVPPPPLFPFIPFQDAIRAWLNYGGGVDQQLHGLDWGETKMKASVAFLGNIPMGTEPAEMRTQPVIHLPYSYIQQQGLTQADAMSHGANSTQLPLLQPQLMNQGSSSDSVPPLLAVPISNLRRSDSSGETTSELFLYPSMTPQTYSGGDTQSSLPLRIQTPPLMMGLGSGTVGGGSMGSNSNAVGAHLFHNPLMFPSTLVTPIELSRSTTQLTQAQLQSAALRLPGLSMGRATSEYPPLHHANGLFPPQLRVPFGTPQLSQQHSLEKDATSHPQSLQIQTTDDSERGQGSSLNVEQTGLNVQQSHLPEIEQQPQPPLQFTTNAGGGNLRPPMFSTEPMMQPPPQLSHPHSKAKSSMVRADGTGQGLSDRDALFLSLPPHHAASAASIEEWEHQLLNRGLLDPRSRYVYTSSQANGHASGSPMMLSSLMPYIREHSSAGSSASQTPHLTGKSRSGSFSMDPLSGMPPLGLESTALGQLQRAAGTGKNVFLSMAAAASAAHLAQEEASNNNEGGGSVYDSPSHINLFGKRKGTSYGYLLPHSYEGQKASAATSAANANDPTGASSSASASASVTTAFHPALVNTNDAYDPFFLDDPNIKSGKHRVVLNLPGFMSSLISYVRQKELKQELNETFASRHEEWINVESKMSLSKIRKCKQLLLDIGMELNLEISTVAVSYIYFEKLILANQVEKSNRKLMSAVCLLLAFKWCEGGTSTTRKKTLHSIFHSCEKWLDVNKSSMLKMEFPVYVLLGFNLTVKTEHVLQHFRQCLSKLDTVPQDYLHIEWSL